MHMGMSMMPLSPNRPAQFPSPQQAYNMPYKDYPNPRTNGRPHLSTIEIPSTSYSTPVSPSSGGRAHSISPGGRSANTSSGSSRSTTTTIATSKSEVSVHASKNWRKAFSLGSISGRSKSPKSPDSNEIRGWWEDPDDPVHQLHRAAPAMVELWRDGNVRRRLGEKRLRLEESAGFYLDEIPRITAMKYIPTDGE
jgi:guanine nucleotide-binding protein alpha-1 subunit